MSIYHQYVCLSVYLSMYLSTYLSIYSFFYLSPYLPIHLSIHPPVYLFVCLSISQNGKLRDMCEDILGRSDKRRSVPLSAASFVSSFLNRPKALWREFSTTAKICPFATGPQQDFSSSPDREKRDILGMILDLFWPIKVTFVVGEPLWNVETANSGRIAVRSPDRAEHAILGVILAGRFFASSGHFWGRGATLWCRNLLFSSIKFTYGHLMEIEWLFADVTAVGFPGRAQRAILGIILAGQAFSQCRPYL